MKKQDYCNLLLVPIPGIVSDRNDACCFYSGRILWRNWKEPETGSCWACCIYQLPVPYKNRVRECNIPRWTDSLKELEGTGLVLVSEGVAYTGYQYTRTDWGESAIHPDTIQYISVTDSLTRKWEHQRKRRYQGTWYYMVPVTGTGTGSLLSTWYSSYPDALTSHMLSIRTSVMIPGSLAPGYHGTNLVP